MEPASLDSGFRRNDEEVRNDEEIRNDEEVRNDKIATPNWKRGLGHILTRQRAGGGAKGGVWRII